MAKVKENSFVARVLAGLNKTEAQIQQEVVTTFVEDSIIECNAQIAYYKTSLIPSKELEITRLQSDLVKAEKALVTARFSIASGFSSYVDNRNSAKRNLYTVKQKISMREVDLATLKAELNGFEEVLTDLQS